MRNLKRVLSLVMACAMMLSLMVFTASAAEITNSVDFTDRDEITNIEAVDILVTLGVIDGKDDGSYDPTGIVTRAEMAKLIAVVLNGGEDPLMGSEASSLYTDTANHWAKAYIAYCTNLGIISGRGDGTFDPEATVTGVEAAKMVLVALGYDSDVFGFTGAGWDTSVNVQANSAKLYAGISSANVSQGLTRDNTAQLIYNGLNAYIMEKTYDKVLSNGEISYNYELSDYKTLMYTAMGAYRIEGVVVANEFADLDGTVNEGALLAGKTRVEVKNLDEINKLNSANGRIALNVSATSTFEVSTGADELGKLVIFYARPAANSNAVNKATVLGAPVISDGNVIATTTGRLKDADAVEKFLKDNGMKYDYEAVLGDWDSDPATPDTYRNVLTCTFTHNYAVSAQPTSNGRGVEFTAVDWQGDGLVDIIMTVQYDLNKVAVVNTAKETVTFDAGLNSGRAIDLDDIVTDLELAEDDIVLGAKIAGKYYIVEPETVTGIVTKRDSDNNITIDGTTYNPSTVACNTTDLVRIDSAFTDLTNEGVFYLDLNGYVIAADMTVDVESQTMCFVAKSTSTDNYGSAYDAYIYFADGTKGVYNITSYNSSSKAADIGSVNPGLYSYSLNDNGVALKDTTTNGTAGVDRTKYNFLLNDYTGTFDFVQNQALNTVGGTPVYFTSDTVFFLQDTSTATGSDGAAIASTPAVAESPARGTKVVTGIENIASQTDFDNVRVAYKVVDGRYIALAVYAGENGTINTATSTDTIFVPSGYWATLNNENYEKAVFFTGDEESTTIVADAQYVPGLYTYAKDSKGVYTLTPSGTSNHSYSGALSVVGNTLYAGTQQVNKLSGGLVFDATDGKNVALTSDSFISNNAYGYVAADKDDNLLAVYVVARYELLPAGITFTSGTGLQSDPLVTASTTAQVVASFTAESANLTIADNGTGLLKITGKDADGRSITDVYVQTAGGAMPTEPVADATNTVTSSTVGYGTMAAATDVTYTQTVAKGVAANGNTLYEVTGGITGDQLEGTSGTIAGMTWAQLNYGGAALTADDTVAVLKLTVPTGATYFKTTTNSTATTCDNANDPALLITLFRDGTTSVTHTVTWYSDAGSTVVATEYITVELQ